MSSKVFIDFIANRMFGLDAFNELYTDYLSHDNIYVSRDITIRDMDDFQKTFDNVKRIWLNQVVTSEIISEIDCEDGETSVLGKTEQHGIVRAILPIVDEVAVTFRFLCEEWPRNNPGHTGGWVIFNPANTRLASKEIVNQGDPQLDVLERVRYYNYKYRQQKANKSF